MKADQDDNFDKFARKAFTVAEARRIALQKAGLKATEPIALEKCIGRTLAEDIRTNEPIPHFRRSGMDGYAVRVEDIAGATSLCPVELEVIEQIPSGYEPKHPITSGQTSRIMTGGMVPDGADAVIMLEMTEQIVRDNRSYASIRKSDSRGSNITLIGEEAGAGDVLLGKGQQISAGQMAVLASLGRSHVTVYQKPVVAILSTGTELLQVDEPLQMGKIRNSNAYMLSAQVRSAGGQPKLLGQIPDQYPLAERMLYELLESDADVIVTTGGVSVGDYDIMADFFSKWAGETLFNKIAMRPGSPTSAGLWKGRLLFGLSGNPSASFVGFELFVRPALKKLQGLSAAASEEHTAILGQDYMKVNAYPRYVRGVREIRDGCIYVSPVGLDKSSAMVTLKDADCLIVIPPTKTGIKAGEIVQSIPIEGVRFP